MACPDCPDCTTINDGNIKLKSHLAEWVKLHPCDAALLSGATDDNEYVYESVCYRVIATPEVKHQRVTIVPFLNGVQQATLTLWYLDDGTVTGVAPGGIERCITDTNVTSVDVLLVAPTGDTSIPAGFLHGSIAIESGTAIINGVARPTGYSLSLPPMIDGDGGNLLYPVYTIATITGTVHVNYHTK